MFSSSRDAALPIQSNQFDFPSLLSPIRSVNNSPLMCGGILYHFSFRPLFLFRVAASSVAAAHTREISFRRGNYAFVNRRSILNLLLTPRFARLISLLDLQFSRKARVHNTRWSYAENESGSILSPCSS